MKATFSFLAKRTVIPLAVVWLLILAVVTGAVAQDFVHQLERNLNWGMPVGNVDDTDPEYSMVESLHYTTFNLNIIDPLFFFQRPQHPSHMSSDDWLWGKWELAYGYQAALAYYDSQGNCIAKSGDYIRFEYEKSDGTVGRSYIDLSKLSEGEELADRYLSNHPAGDYAPFFINESMYLRGWFEGAEFHPVRIRLGSPLGLVYERTDVPDKDLVSIYPTNYYGLNYTPGSAFSVDGVRYSDVRQTLSAKDTVTREGLFNTVLSHAVNFQKGGQGYTAKFAVQCNPIKYAVLRLMPAYLFSTLLLGLCLHFILKGIRKNLTEPLQVINRGYMHNRRELSEYADSPLAELKELGSHFNEKQGLLHDSAQQLQQLRTALDYAKSAEENRRQLVSALAHELKTPLAVIHSYAEGLQDGIAGDQTDHYLHVIQEETERMDALVLQMLDLSRLEAGKVKLRNDRFSLSELTDRVLQKQALAIEDKKLQVTFALREKRTVVADENRMEQVVTNLVTNAIKYTPVEGSIHIKIFSHMGNIHFLIENTCDPMPPEVLEKLWDSFYRADAARSSSGTGLGLTIVKSIVQLHRGSCKVRNTKDGVEFSFTLPL